MNRSSWRSLVCLFAAALVVGCGTSGGTGPGGSGSISISLSKTTVTAPQGGTDNLTASITRAGGFDGDVAIATAGAPSGVTAAASNVSTTGGTTTGTITVTVAASVNPGNYPLTVTASGNGVATVQAQVTLIVTAIPAISLSLNPAAVTIAQAASGTSTVSLARTNFTGTVDLTVTGLPQGVTAQFAPAAVTGTSSVLTLTVAAAVAAQAYPLVVRGTASGLTDALTNLTLTVTAGVQGSYSLTATPSSPISIQQNGQSNVTININRTGGFAGAVTLSASDAPQPAGANAVSVAPGITLQFSPATTTGNSSALTVQVAGSAALGSYGFVITGTAVGLANQQATITVTVTAASGGGNVTLDFRACFQPIWVGYQDGAGAWTQAALSNGVYRFNIASATGAYAYVLNVGQSYVTSTHYHTRAELIGLTGQQLCGSGPSGGKTLVGTAAGITAGFRATTSLGGRATTATPGSLNLTLTNVPDGTHDLISYMQAIGTIGTSDRVIARRGINTAAIAPGGSFGPVLDFATGEAQQPSVAAIGLTNTAGDDLAAGVTLYTTAACQPATLYSAVPLGPVTSFNANLLPALLAQGTDFYSVMVTAANAGQTTLRSVTQSFQGTAPASIAMGSQIPAFTPAPVAGPYKRLQFQLTLPNDLSELVNAQFSNRTLEAGFVKTMSMIATSGYLGGSAVDLSTPDFTSAGYNATWAPSTALDWRLSGVGASPASVCTNGARFVIGQRSGTA